MTAALGGTLTLQVGDHTLEMKVPAGAEDGKKMRLSGQGPGGADLIVRLRVQRHPYFRREGNDVILDVPLTVAEAALGARVDVPTLGGDRRRVPASRGAPGGPRWGLRGSGTGGAHQSREFKLVRPPSLNQRSRELIEEFARLNPQNPRTGPPWA